MQHSCPTSGSPFQLWSWSVLKLDQRVTNDCVMDSLQSGQPPSLLERPLAFLAHRNRRPTPRMRLTQSIRGQEAHDS